MRKGAVPLIAALALYLLSTSSDRKDRVDIENRLYVVSLGVDMGPRGSDDLILDAEVAKWRPLNGAGVASGPGGGPEKPSWQLKASGATLAGGMARMQTESSRPISLSHLDVLVIGEEAAKRGLRRVVYAMERNAEVQGRLQVVVAKGEASNIVEAQPPIEQIAAFVIPGIVDVLSSDQWLYHTTLEQAVEGIFLKRPFMLPQVGVAPYEAIRVEGLAVFTGGKLAGWLSGAEVMKLAWVAGAMRGGVVEFEHSEGGNSRTGGEDAFVVTSAHTKYRLIRKGSRLTVKVDIWAEGNVVEGEPGIAQSSSLRRADEAIGIVVRKQMQEAIDMGIKRFHADIFGIGLHIEQHDPWLWAEVKPDWDAKLGKQVVIEPGVIDINVRRVGLMR